MQKGVFFVFPPCNDALKIDYGQVFLWIALVFQRFVCPGSVAQHMTSQNDPEYQVQRHFGEIRLKIALFTMLGNANITQKSATNLTPIRSRGGLGVHTTENGEWPAGTGLTPTRAWPAS